MTKKMEIEKRKRVSGKQRDEASLRIILAYEEGSSIRSIATEWGRSYGWVHRLLADGGVRFRPRGGNQRGAK
jgi:hypothetical protein